MAAEALLLINFFFGEETIYKLKKNYAANYYRYLGISDLMNYNPKEISWRSVWMRYLVVPGIIRTDGEAE